MPALRHFSVKCVCITLESYWIMFSWYFKFASYIFQYLRKVIILIRPLKIFLKSSAACSLLVWKPEQFSLSLLHLHCRLFECSTPFIAKMSACLVCCDRFKQLSDYLKYNSLVSVFFLVLLYSCTRQLPNIFLFVVLILVLVVLKRHDLTI